LLIGQRHFPPLTSAACIRFRCRSGRLRQPGGGRRERRPKHFMLSADVHDCTSCRDSGTDACATCVHRPGRRGGLTWAGRVGGNAITTETTTVMSAGTEAAAAGQ